MSFARSRIDVVGLIPTLFGLAWMLLGVSALGVPLRLPAAVGASVAAIALVVFARDRAPAPRRRPDWAMFGIGVGLEVAGIVLALLLGNAISRSDIILPLEALAVGIHFVFVAKAFHARALIGTALAMSTFAAAALFLPDAVRFFVVGFGSGATLWITTLSFIVLSRRAA